MATIDFDQAFDFNDRVVVVTGAAGGIGREITRVFAQRGARLALVDRDGGVHALAEATGGGARGFIADITDEQAIEACVAAIVAAFGRIDVLVNNAAIGHVGPAEAIPTGEWDSVIAINLRGQYLFARAVAPVMLAARYGRIVMMASQAAVVGIEGHAAYSAAKAGVVGMVRCMAIEWGPAGVTVNAVSPTVVETPMALVGWSGEKGERAKAQIPTRRFAQPVEIALAILYLASGAAGMVNGANLSIDGGYTAQ
ncbi:2-deoxy-D-gluconate 3-dehydrogenase [Ameyamaea chiangmaiensis NBRC 103196]|uniref:D-threitol dehydrogenase n=1 Tax=Ameyamaea chiangmaiensis TaxID=442969 RepID=A0A850PE33_9PROT|nr:D-threitol dehydrogenase [Ameyamaea chiangmaiensis]MBS4075154.1 D-threitol dehydrogenase [Ameyamaea chiangmaiensis]NVN40202.1 D-threitol dehydrogenase [Ameyamaea chiangmaiensis]GBQ66252.1 2-deoxy-D-gluconate 3-dehydrogenase [Ameyamaea chiangmaiensis NBRC 103196]